MHNSEEQYINVRKRKAFRESLAYYICHIFPIKKNKIVMWTFEGAGGYACSPKYIAEEILKRNWMGKSDYKIYWIVKDTSKEFPPEIIKVKDSLWARAFHLSTARYWIGNTRTYWGTVKRKKTTYIQTWHGSLSLKPIGKCRGDKFSRIAYLVSKADSDLMDYAISGSKWCTDMWPDGLIYDGQIETLGNPRCDVLFNSVKEKHTQFRQEYGLPENAKILLYAPTFRGGSQNTNRSVDLEQITLDFENVIHALENKFGGIWYVFMRIHPQLAATIKELPLKDKSSRLIDVSQRPDMAEIMAATDAIITDYSTVIFEGFLTGQPGFIYADDLEAYVADRGKLMFELKDIPFPVARNNQKLIQNIVDFDLNTYREKSKAFIEANGIVDDGMATIRVVDKLLL